MRPFALLLLLVCIGLGAAETAKAAPATVFLRNGNVQEGGVVYNETMDGVLTAQREGDQPVLMSWSQVLRVKYANVDSEQRYYVGVANFTQNKWIEAIGNLSGATQSRFSHIAIDSFLRIAEANNNLKKYTEAIAALDQLDKAYPSFRRSGEAQYLRGVALVGQGKAAEATAQFKKIRDLSALGDLAKLYSAKGEALVKRSSGDVAGAAAVLAAAFADMKAESSPEGFAAIGSQLMDDYVATKDNAKLLALCERLYYVPGVSAIQLRARMQAADMYAAMPGTDNLVKAFDNACIVALNSSNNEQLRHASDLAKKLVGQLDKSDLPQPDRQEYRSYLALLP